MNLLNAIKSLQGSQPTLAQTAIPIIMLPTGAAIGATGIVTGLTALPETYSNGIYCYVPSGYIATASAAGIYWGVGASTTSVQLYNNVLASNQIPSYIANPTAFAGLSGGSFTAGTAVQTVLAVKIPANTLGPNGRVRIVYGFSNNNSGGTKTFNILWAAASLAVETATTALSGSILRNLINRGVTNAQISEAAAVVGPAAGSGQYLFYTADTTTDINVNFQLQVGVATDYSILNYAAVELFPAP